MKLKIASLALFATGLTLRVPAVEVRVAAAIAVLAGLVFLVALFAKGDARSRLQVIGFVLTCIFGMVSLVNGLTGTQWLWTSLGMGLVAITTVIVVTKDWAPQRAPGRVER